MRAIQRRMGHWRQNWFPRGGRRTAVVAPTGCTGDLVQAQLMDQTVRTVPHDSGTGGQEH